jgi:hypothetical protein
MQACLSLEQFIEANPYVYNKLCYWAKRRNGANPRTEVQTYLRELVLEVVPQQNNTVLLKKWARILSQQERHGLTTLSPILIGAYANSDRWYSLQQGEYSVLCEPVLHEICYQGQQQSIITRNRYGCLVLNTNQLLIVDVDIEVPQYADVQDCPTSCRVAVSQKQAIAALRVLVEQFPLLGFRVYCTRNGLRYFCTTHEFNPLDRKTYQLMQNLYVDPLYARLCRFQATFRARLTPKPWRVEPNQTKRFVYDRSIGLVIPELTSCAVCHLVETIGMQKTLPQFEKTIQIHDAYCQVSRAQLELA